MAHERDPKRSPYVIARAFRFPRDLDLDCFERAVQTLTDRHPAIRTIFGHEGGVPFQRVRDRHRATIERVDAREWTDDHLLQTLDRASVLDLSVPSFRVTLFDRSNETVVLVAVHHLVSDLWSLALMVDELRSLYEAARCGRTTHLPPVRSSYEEYVDQELRLVSSSRGDHLWQFWRDELAGIEPLQAFLPNRGTSTRARAAIHSFVLPRPLVRRLTTAARAHDVTLAMLLLTAWQTLLFRHTGQTDFLLSLPLIRRRHHAFAGVVGYFAEPLPVRARIRVRLWQVQAQPRQATGLRSRRRSSQ